MRLRASLFSNMSFLLVSFCGVLQAQSKPPRYLVKDLGALPGPSFSQPGQLSDSGLIAGYSIAPDGFQHPVLWVADHIIDLDWSGDGGLNASAFGINSLGRVSIRRKSLTMTLMAKTSAHTAHIECVLLLCGNGANSLTCRHSAETTAQLEI